MENNTYHNYDKLSNIQKYYLIVNAAKIVHSRFNYLLENKSGLHCHHIKPKSLYPDLENDKQNLIKVPSIVHWTLHKILLNYYKEINNEVAIKKMSYVNLEDFINDFYKNKKKKFNFDDDISVYFFSIFDTCTTIIYYETHLQMLETRCQYIQELFNAKKKQSKNTDEYEHFKSKGKYYEEYRKELNAARNIESGVREKFRAYIKTDYINLTEELLDMYGEDIKDELDDCYEDLSDLCNTLQSIKEEDPLEKLRNIPSEELKEL